MDKEKTLKLATIKSEQGKGYGWVITREYYFFKFNFKGK